MYSHISERIRLSVKTFLHCDLSHVQTWSSGQTVYLLRIFCYLDCFLDRMDLDRSIYNCYSVF